MLSVGAVRPLATAAPLGGAGPIDDCQPHDDLNDDVVSVGAWAPMNRPAMCCARSDDFVVRTGHWSRSYGSYSG